MCSYTIAAEFRSAWKVRTCARKLSAFWNSDIRVTSPWWATIVPAIRPAHFADVSIPPGWRARRSPRLLFVMHKWGGGTEKHIQELAAMLEPDYEVFILRAFDATTAVLEWARRGEEFSAWFPLPHAYPELLAFLRNCR